MPTTFTWGAPTAPTGTGGARPAGGSAPRRVPGGRGQVAIAHQADQPLVIVDDRHLPDPERAQDLPRLRDRRARTDGDRTFDHDLVHLHVFFSPDSRGA